MNQGRIRLTWLLAATLLASGCDRLMAQPASRAQTEEERTIYALGLKMGRHLSSLDLSPTEQRLLTQGVADALSGAQTPIDPKSYQPQIQELASRRRAIRGK